MVKLSQKERPSIRAVFSNRGLDKVLSGQIQPTENTADNDEILSLSRALAEKKILPEKPISFLSVPELVGVDYVGYIIDKQRLEKKIGRWIPVGEYAIAGSSVNSFKDTRVAYGQTYRYRIRSVAKVTIPVIRENFNPSQAQRSLDVLQGRITQEQLEANKTFLENIQNYINRGISFKKSQGQQASEIQLSDGVILKNTPEITKIESKANNVAKKIQDTRREENLRLRDANGLNKAISSEELQRVFNDLAKSFFEEFIEYRSFYYASETNRRWRYTHITEREPPPPPSSIKIVPDSIREVVNIFWLVPPSSQRDIKSVKIYRRTSTEEGWELLKESPISNINFTDTLEDFKDVEGRILDFSTNYIYALTSKDVHGIESFLSSQTKVSLNPRIRTDKQELPLRLVSFPGAKPSEREVVNRFKKDIENLKFFDKIDIKPAIKFLESRKDLVLKITSLDTHETQEIKLTLKNTT